MQGTAAFRGKRDFPLHMAFPRSSWGQEIHPLFMKKNHSLSFLAQSMLAALLMISSALADVAGHLLVESSGIKTGSEQLDVRFAGNGEVRISWDEQSMRNAILQVSRNCVDWTEVANASSPFFTPLNNEVSTYYRVVYTLSGANTNPAPVDFGKVGINGDSAGDGLFLDQGTPVHIIDSHEDGGEDGQPDSELAGIIEGRTSLIDAIGSPDSNLAGNPTYEVPMNLVLELEINRLIELRELVELHGEEHDLVGEIPFDQILADIDQIIAQGEQMDEAGRVSMSGSDWVELAMANPVSQAFTFLKEFVEANIDFMREVDKGGLNALRNQEERDNRDYDGDGTIGHPEEESAGGEGDEDGEGADGGSEGGSDDQTDGIIMVGPDWENDTGNDDDDGDGIPNWRDTDNDDDDNGPMANGTSSDLIDLIDLIDQAYSPFAFGEAVQTSLETTGLEGIRTLVDNQLEALEQLNASGGIVEANVENHLELDNVAGGDSGGLLIDISGGQ